MAVVENAGSDAITSSNHDNAAAANCQKSTDAADQNSQLMPEKVSNGHHQPPINGNGVSLEKKLDGEEDDGGEGFKREMRDLEEMLSKLNPMAKEFVPPSLAGGQYKFLSPPPHPAVVAAAAAGHFGFNANGFVMQHINSAGFDFNPNENSFKRVTEGQLAALFVSCGQVVDCRICGDPNSVLRFAFIEFTDEEGARNALSLAGTMLGFYPVRVLPSKTAISPVNPTFLPRSEDEREMCAKTIYCTNIDKKVTQADIKLFFESICGEVYRLRLLGDYHHSTRIAFVEFVMISRLLDHSF